MNPPYLENLLTPEHDTSQDEPSRFPGEGAQIEERNERAIAADVELVKAVGCGEE